MSSVSFSYTSSFHTLRYIIRAVEARMEKRDFTPGAPGRKPLIPPTQAAQLKADLNSASQAGGGEH